MQPTIPALDIVTELPTLPPRPLDSNKATFGKVLVLAGSRGMSGAAVLCGQAALRGGAGLVRVALPEEILPQVAAANPCYLTVALPQDAQGHVSAHAEEIIMTLARTSTVLAVGPGLGVSPAISNLMFTLLAQSSAPMILDADGLNAVLGHTSKMQGHRGPLILTPHPGEFARLVQSDVATVEDYRQELAVCFALEHNVVLVLKGHSTIVTDGKRLYNNTTGNPGMATGGTGDVLTGLIAALLGQGLAPFQAAQLGVYLHGLAGDLARDSVGEISLIASDLLVHLPQAFLRSFPPQATKKN